MIAPYLVGAVIALVAFYVSKVIKLYLKDQDYFEKLGIPQERITLWQLLQFFIYPKTAQEVIINPYQSRRNEK